MQLQSTTWDLDIFVICRTFCTLLKNWLKADEVSVLFGRGWKGSVCLCVCVCVCVCGEGGGEGGTLMSSKVH